MLLTRHQINVSSGGVGMDEIVFGSILLIAGVISLLTHRRAVEKGTARLRDWAPNSDGKILKVGSAFRSAFTVLCLVLGIGFIVFGIIQQR
jgi:hypothetical protein